MALAPRNRPGAPKHRLYEIAKARFGREGGTARGILAWLTEEKMAGRIKVGLPGPRTVERWVRDWKPATTPQKYEPPEFWEPWLGDEATEESDYLLRLDLLTRAWWGHPLDLVEAKWARKIRAGVTGLEFFAQWALIQEFAHREAASQQIGFPDPSTGDLDDLIAIKPWDPGGAERLDWAIDAGLTQRPYYAGLRIGFGFGFREGFGGVVGDQGDESSEDINVWINDKLNGRPTSLHFGLDELLRRLARRNRTEVDNAE